MFFEDLHHAPDVFVNKIMNFMGIESPISLDMRPLVINASPSTLSIHVMRTMNLLTRTGIPSRYMDPEERAKILQRLRFRKKLCHLPFFVASHLQRVVPARLTCLPTEKLRPLIEQTYGENNRRLFSLLGLDIHLYQYPGSDLNKCE